MAPATRRLHAVAAALGSHIITSPVAEARKPGVRHAAAARHGSHGHEISLPSCCSPAPPPHAAGPAPVSQQVGASISGTVLRHDRLSSPPGRARARGVMHRRNRHAGGWHALPPPLCPSFPSPTRGRPRERGRSIA